MSTEQVPDPWAEPKQAPWPDRFKDRHCQWCGIDKGIPRHLVLGPDGPGDWRWVCDDCANEWWQS